MTQNSLQEINTRKIEQDLLQFLIKEKLNAEEIHLLSTLAEYKEFKSGELVLAEGANNHSLFFLVEGRVDVIHGGERIASLSTPGDILGEMSLITKKTCTASNYAHGRCIFLVLQPSQVTHLPPRLQLIFTHAVNQLFLGILADRLSETNEKARLFEITNRELIAAKKALESASLTRIHELRSGQINLVEKMNSILKKRLPSVHKLSSELAAQIDSKTTLWQPLQSEMFGVFNEFEELVSHFEKETKPQNTKVLLVESEIEEQINAKMSLVGTGVQVTVAGTLELAQAAIQENDFNIICLSHPFVELIEFARSVGVHSQFVFITSEPIGQHFETLSKYPEFNNILTRHPNDRAFTIKNIATTIRKLSGQDLFGMDKYLNWGTEITEHEVTGSEQRSELLTNLENFAKSIDVRTALRGKVLRVAEEMLMNTIYDAPTDPQGRSKYNHLKRTDTIKLQPSEYAQFNYACDGSFFALSAIDPFGALTRSTVLENLERCLKGDSISVEIEGKGGGGNGLFQMIQSSSLTVFNVWPKRKTEVIVLFNINYQVQKISLHPSFQFFEVT